MLLDQKFKYFVKFTKLVFFFKLIFDMYISLKCFNEYMKLKV